MPYANREDQEIYFPLALQWFLFFSARKQASLDFWLDKCYFTINIYIIS